MRKNFVEKQWTKLTLSRSQTTSMQCFRLLASRGARLVSRRLFYSGHKAAGMESSPVRRALPLLGVVGGSTLLAGILLKKTDHDDSRILEMAESATNTAGPSVGEDLTLTEGREFANVIQTCRRMVQFKREELGLPGLVIAVSIDGKIIWQEGFGYSDVENLTPCRSDSAMRIASISKPIAMAIAARLIDQGKLDLDKSIQHYVPKFPQKSVDGKKVEITTRQLVSHLGGIRHYEKNSTKDSIADGDMAEFYIKEEYKSVSDALEIFMNDDLENKPGTKFLYTTHGWTLISAVLEGASGETFVKLTQNLYKDLNMSNSYLGYHLPLIPNHARYYRRTNKGKLENTPYVDLSCKWAGGGLISTVEDLCIFGNAMLRSYQQPNGYIRQKTLHEMWTVSEPTRDGPKWVQNGGYGQGWGVNEGNRDFTKGEPKPFYASHTGGAIGASSVLTVFPSASPDEVPSGVVVAMITNLQAISMSKLGLEIGQKFVTGRNSE